MENAFDRKRHWEAVYGTKEPSDVSWYQPVPEVSLDLIKRSEVPVDAAIIDVGGGDSMLADHLLDAGYRNLTVLDISVRALKRARKRLGEKADGIKWLLSDVAQFDPQEKYDLWHDRAAFHFLTEAEDVKHYVATAASAVRPGGTLIIGTFSITGPEKCSGISVKRYSEETLFELFAASFEKPDCFVTDHRTPFDTLQNFVFCRLKRKF
jgi:2-polyprenyl-3-methyl-5-hydroxy-6-metoxy-1,4-benzoquinol methylase